MLRCFCHRCISVSLTARFSLSFPTMMVHRLRRGSCQMTDQYYKENQTKRMRGPFLIRCPLNQDCERKGNPLKGLIPKSWKRSVSSRQLGCTAGLFLGLLLKGQRVKRWAIMASFWIIWCYKLINTLQTLPMHGHAQLHEDFWWTKWKMEAPCCRL